MATITVGILGLGRMGASLGLALRRYNASKGAQHQFKITAYERRGAVQQEARKFNPADEYINSPFNAVREKDIVVLALPYSDVQSMYEVLGRELRPGGVVFDTSSIKSPSLGWAQKYLPSEVYMVGITPVLNPRLLYTSVDETAAAREDLFDNGLMLLMPGIGCAKEAVELATDFGQLLGAKSHFIDPAEHDGLMAATDGLPALLGVLFYHMLRSSPGWNDGQRLTNPAFAYLTHHLYDTHPDDLRDVFMHNRDNMLRYLDAMLSTLRNFRQALAQNDRNAVEAAVVDSALDYEKWLNRRTKNEWDEKDALGKAASAAGDIVTGLFGTYLGNRLRGKKDDEKK
ncbi:MAG: prephenate dehydrogenase [Chloroflexi bacterium]|nr:prephenate dehydrogenase [Chloroflexota bacterium]